MRWIGLTLTLLLRGVVNPRTGYALMAMAWRFRRRHWWRVPPFLPIPPASYMQWRMHTAYGDHHAVGQLGNGRAHGKYIYILQFFYFVLERYSSK